MKSAISSIIYESLLAVIVCWVEYIEGKREIFPVCINQYRRSKVSLLDKASSSALPSERHSQQSWSFPFIQWKHQIFPPARGSSFLFYPEGPMDNCLGYKVSDIRSLFQNVLIWTFNFFIFCFQSRLKSFVLVSSKYFLKSIHCFSRVFMNVSTFWAQGFQRFSRYCSLWKW